MNMNLTDFDHERLRLTAIPTRILGSATEADDVIQEAQLRGARAEGVDDLPAWLTTVVTRLWVYHLRKKTTRSRFEAEVSVDVAPVPHRVSSTASALPPRSWPVVRVAFVFYVEAGLARAIELIADPDVLATMDVRR
jgi:DNA-directed RNA polymerase specialized sigma24 family protein